MANGVYPQGLEKINLKELQEYIDTYPSRGRMRILLGEFGSSAETVGMNEWLDSSAAPIGTFDCVLAMRIGIKPGAFGAPLCGYGA